MTKDDRANICGIVGAFVPNLTQDIDEPAKVPDERIMAILGEALAQLDAEIVELRQNLETLAQIGANPLPAPMPEAIAPEHLAALLRHYKVQYLEVYDEVYFDELERQRVRPKLVPRPAVVDDILGQREDLDGVTVVLRDGKRHRLNYLDKEIA